MVEWYKGTVANNANVEMIFYSKDFDEDAMETWIKNEQMPWPTIKFRSKDRLKAVAKHAGRGVPNYVMVDAHNEVVAKGKPAISAKIKELSGS